MRPEVGTPRPMTTLGEDGRPRVHDEPVGADARSVLSLLAAVQARQGGRRGAAARAGKPAQAAGQNAAKPAKKARRSKPAKKDGQVACRQPHIPRLFGKLSPS